MESSHLRQLISAFNSLERKDIRRFLESPYFNQRRDLVLLFDWFCRTATPEKESAKQHLFGAGEVPDQELRLRMSYLSRLIERYLAQKAFEALDTEVKLRALTGMRRRGLDKHFEKMRRNIEISLENSPLRDSTFHESHFRLHWEKYQMQYAVKQTELDSLQAASQAADVAYLAQKLRLICLSAAYKMVYSMEDQAIWEKEILAFAEQHVAQTHPAISIYLHCYRMLSNPAEEVHFHAFKAMLLDSGPVFSAEERRGLFIWAINYCVRRINAGEKTYSREVSGRIFATACRIGWTRRALRRSRTFEARACAGFRTSRTSISHFAPWRESTSRSAFAATSAMLRAMTRRTSAST